MTHSANPIKRESMIASFISSKPLSYYKCSVLSGTFNITLTHDQSAVILKAHDRGIDDLNFEEKHLLALIIADLTTEITI